jgi:hypothetical protein
MQRVVTVHFNTLPEKVRKRFIDCLAGRAEPRPLLSAGRPWIGALIGWAFLALGASALMLGLGADGLGSDLQEPPMLALYAVCGLALLASLIAIVRRVRLQKALPFQPGSYLFRLDLVEAFGPRLRILPMSKLTDFGATHHHTNGVYTYTELRMSFEGGARAVLNVGGKALVESAMEQLRTTRETILAALQREDVGALYAMDPFFGLEADKLDVERLASEEPISDTQEAVARPVHALSRKTKLVYALLGLGLGAAWWAGRNVLSDQMYYSRLKHFATLALAEGPMPELPYSEQVDVWEFQDYVRVGWLHVPEVRDVLLPAAAFRKAKDANTVAALRQFLAEYPGSAPEARARQALHELYANALAEFKKQAAEADPRSVAFLEQLFAYQEGHGSPPLDVRFRPPDLDSLARIDQALQEKFGGEPSGLAAGPGEGLTQGAGTPDVHPIAPSFTDERMVPREKTIVTNLQRAFTGIFHNDVLELRYGERIGAEEPPAAKPVVEVAYSVSPSGSIYTAETGNDAYVGIAVDFIVTLRVPGQAEPLRFPLQVEPPQRFQVEYTRSSFSLDTGPSTELVYETMATRAFEALNGKLHEVFFGTPPEGAGQESE